MIASVETRPPATRISVVHHLAPASHVRLATIQVVATTTLTKVKSILPEEAMSINGTMGNFSHATGTHNNPSLAGIGAMVPEPHASVTTTLEHLKPHKTPTGTKVFLGRSAAPTVQAIIVDRESIVEPQLAPIIGMDLEVVMACPEDSQAASPTHSKVIAAGKTMPSAASIFIVHIMSPASHIRSSTLQVLATASLTKVEDVFSEETMTVSDGESAMIPAPCTYNSPSFPSIGSVIPE
jgi:hypothetical protein